MQVIVNDKSEFVKRKANADKWLEEYEANNPEQLDTAEQLKKPRNTTVSMRWLWITWQKETKGSRRENRPHV